MMQTIYDCLMTWVEEKREEEIMILMEPGESQYVTGGLVPKLEVEVADLLK